MELEPDACAAPDGTVHPDPPAVRLDDALDRREADPAAVAPLVRAGEQHEHRLLLLARHPDTVVGDRDPPSAPGPTRQF